MDLRHEEVLVGCCNDETELGQCLWVQKEGADLKDVGLQTWEDLVTDCMEQVSVTRSLKWLYFSLDAFLK